MKGPFNSFQEALSCARTVSAKESVDVELRHQDTVETKWFIDWKEPEAKAEPDIDLGDDHDPYDDPDLYKYAECDSDAQLYEYEMEEARMERWGGSSLDAHDYARIEESGWFED